MSARQHFWELLRDVLGVGGTRPGAGTDPELVESLTQCNEALTASAVRLRGEREQLRELEAQQAQALIGPPPGGVEARDTASLDATRARIDQLSASHDALRRDRDALLERLRAGNLRAPASGAPRAVPPEHDRGASSALSYRLTRLARAGSHAVEARRLADQLERLEAQLTGFTRLLGRKLNAGELTYLRFTRTVEETCDAVLDRLAAAADAVELLDRLEPAPDAAPDADEQTLAARARLAHQQRGKLAQTGADNEAALIALAELSAALAELPELTSGAPTDLDTAIRDIDELVRRVARLG